MWLGCLSKTLRNSSNNLRINLRSLHSFKRTTSQTPNLIKDDVLLCNRQQTFKFHHNQLSSLISRQSNVMKIQKRFNSSTPKALSEAIKSSVEKELSNSDIIDLSDFQIPHLMTPEEIQSMEIILSATDLGLTWWLPTGGLYYLFDYVHKLGVGWPTAIIISTIFIRSLLIPISISTKKKSGEISAYMNKFKNFQTEMERAQMKGNVMEINKLALKYNDVIGSNESFSKLTQNQFQMMKMPVAQLFLFTSFFICLRKMANYPIPSLHETSFLWLPSLAEKDPYYILPVITASTLFLTLRIGIDTGTIGINISKTQKAIIFIMPIVSLLITFSFPSALCLYWCTANFHSLATAYILKIERVKNYLDIEDIPKPEEDKNKSNIDLSSIVKVKKTYKGMF